MDVEIFDKLIDDYMKTIIKQFQDDLDHNMIYGDVNSNDEIYIDASGCYNLNHTIYSFPYNIIKQYYYKIAHKIKEINSHTTGYFTTYLIIPKYYKI